MNTYCQRCGSPAGVPQKPCPSCGLVRDPRSFFSASAPGSPQRLARTSRVLAGTPGTSTLSGVSLFQPGTTLDTEHYLLLTPQHVQQWGANAIETRWLAQETDPETQQQRTITIVDVALPTYEHCQSVSRAARRAFMHNQDATLLHAFLEQMHCLFVFADDASGSLQERIDQHHLLSEQEARTCFQHLARAMGRLSRLEPSVVHGWICPAHVVQRGTQWHLLPGSGLVAGEAAHCATIQVPPGVSLQTEGDLLAVFQTMYAGLTGLMPPPPSGNLGFPSPPSCVSTSFAALLAHGLQGGFRTPTDLLVACGERATNHAPHSHMYSSPVSRPGKGPHATFPSPIKSGAPHQGSETRTPESLQKRKPPGKQMDAYPLAPDARHALYWSSGILLAEVLVLLLSR